VVDDDPSLVDVIRRILATRGYTALTAGSGSEALEVALQEKPDVILLDWILPGLNGLEVCQKLKSNPETRGIMILLVTARSSLDNRLEGFDAGADDFIPKPFNQLELLARVRSALRIKELTDDLAERNRQLMSSRSELIRAEKMATIGLLASGIAHSFNNIIAGISGFAQLAKRNPTYLPRLVEVALVQSERAMELTRSLATYNQRNGDECGCDVVRVIEGASCLIRKELQSNNIHLITEFACRPRAAVSAGQLQEVVLNMLVNSIHALDRGGSITVRVRAESSAGEVEIEISDTGCGIAPENLSRIFDPFFTTKGVASGRRQQGTGLGLAVSYNIVQSRGGRIAVQSEVGRGTTFTVTLPVHAGATEDTSPPAARCPPQKSDGRRLRLLVVDDEGQMRELLQNFLGDQEVVCCPSGEEAIRRYTEQPFDYVILDVCMHESLDGLETLKRLRGIDPKAQVIVASGNLVDDLDPEVMALARAHLVKPFQLEDLAAVLGLKVEV
jgi:signal transduction histidine kinase